MHEAGRYPCRSAQPARPPKPWPPTLRGRAGRPAQTRLGGVRDLMLQVWDAGQNVLKNVPLRSTQVKKVAGSSADRVMVASVVAMAVKPAAR